MHGKILPLKPVRRRLFFLKSNTVNIHVYATILAQNLGTDAGTLKKFP